MSRYRNFTVLSLTVLLAVTASGRAEEKKWGTIKGTVVFDGAVVPERKKITPNNDKDFCEKNGAVLSDELVVDKTTKGVRWVMVWLLDEKGGTKLPIHPQLAKAAEKVVIDQPCCVYEPHVFGMRTGQILVAKNSATVPHNVNILGGGVNPEKNVLIPAGKFLEVDGWKASSSVVPIKCTIHTFMKSWVWVFDHPYFAVTNEKGEFEIKDAPAGKFRMVVWQESVGWVVKEGDDTGKKGVPVEIKPDAVTDLGKIKLTPSKE